MHIQPFPVSGMAVPLDPQTGEGLNGGTYRLQIAFSIATTLLELPELFGRILEPVKAIHDGVTGFSDDLNDLINAWRLFLLCRCVVGGWHGFPFWFGWLRLGGGWGL